MREVELVLSHSFLVSVPFQRSCFPPHFTFIASAFPLACFRPFASIRLPERVCCFHLLSERASSRKSDSHFGVVCTFAPTPSSKLSRLCIV